MTHIIILDENQKKLNEFNLVNNYKDNSFERYENIVELDNMNKEVLNKTDELIGVYSPIKNADDFYIIFLNSALLNFSALDTNDYKGRLVSDMFFNNNQNKTMLNKMKEVYLTKKSQRLFIEYYTNNVLKRCFNVKISRIANYIFIITEDKTNYRYLSIEEEVLFENDFNAISIIQDGCFVKVNKKYIKLSKSNSYDEIIGQKINNINLHPTIIKKMNDIIDKILNEKLFSYSTNLKIVKEDKPTYYFNLNGSFINYKGKPAVMVIYYNITNQELNRKKIEKETQETLLLQTNFDFIESISNIGVTNVINGKFIRSSKLYEILEREPFEDDIDRYIFVDFIIDEDLPILEKSCAKIYKGANSVDDIVRIKTSKNNLKYLHFYINVNNSDNYLDLVIFCQDVTNEQLYLKNLQKTLDETLRLEDNLNRIQLVSKTAIGFSDNLYISHWTPEIFDLLEINPDDYINNTNNLIERFVIDEDLELRNKCINSLSPLRPDIKFNQRVLTGKGNIKYIKTVMHHEYKDNKLINRISFNQDITLQTEYEIKLESTLKDRGILLSEVHHRVKNNLQIILSLISLNMNYNKSPEDILKDTQDRIYSMALIHEKIYGSESLSAVNMKEYTQSLVKSLFDLYDSKIKFHSYIESFELNMEEAIPLGLIINELVNNTIKYAFPDKDDGNLYIKFNKVNKHYTFILFDDGIGLPSDLNLDNVSSLGLIVVKNLTLQIGGNISFIDCKGTGYKIEFDET